MHKSLLLKFRQIFRIVGQFFFFCILKPCYSKHRLIRHLYDCKERLIVQFVLSRISNFLFNFNRPTKTDASSGAYGVQKRGIFARSSLKGKGRSGGKYLSMTNKPLEDLLRSNLSSLQHGGIQCCRHRCPGNKRKSISAGKKTFELD